MTVYGGDIIYAADINAFQEKPLLRMVASGAQTLTDATQTAIAFSGADDIDTSGAHNPASNNTRVTPTVAGYYSFRGTFFMSSLVNGATVDVNIRLNGSTNLAGGSRLGGAAGHTVTTSGAPSTIGNSNAFSTACYALVAMNGTTDYIEMVARQDSNGNDDTNQSSQFSSVLEMVFERPL